MHNSPLVSICIPTYNGQQFIAEAISSALAQTYKNLEINVSDDASKDDTLSIIKNYTSKTQIPIHIFNHKPNGIGANWNNCLLKANGKYIKFLFQDDVLSPTCVEEMVEVLETNPHIGLVTSKRDFIVDKAHASKEVETWIETCGNLQRTLDLKVENNISIIDKSLLKSAEFLNPPRNKVGEPSIVMFRKDLVDKIGLFDENLKQILDCEYWYRILKYKDIAVIHKNLASFRLHANQATNVNNQNAITDYHAYNKILYSQYLKLLHPEVQKRLLRKYNLFYKVYYWVVDKFKSK